MRKSSQHTWGVPLILLGITLAAYGWFMTQKGYYWDDWGFVWSSQYSENSVLVTRPLWSYLYKVTTAFIGPNPVEWQVFALITRWLLAVTLWWVMRLTWPNYPRLAFTTALLALVYPGFSQHSIALIYGHYSLTFAVFFVSVALGLLSMRTERLRWLLILGGVTLSALHLFSVEYYFGLELLRPALIWVVAGETTSTIRQRLWRTLKAYLPFAIVPLAFVLWRVLIFESKYYNLDKNLSRLTLPGLAENAARSIWAASASAWSKLISLPPFDEMGTRLGLVYAGILLMVLAGIYIYVVRSSHLDETTEPKAGRKPFLEWFAVGAIAVLLAGIPFFIANLEVKSFFPSDRFTQPFALGTALILAAGLELLPRASWRALGTGILITLATSVQIANAFAFREDWRMQTDYFWQLSWRAPALKPGTVIASEDSPFRFTDDDALTFAVNWSYVPDYEGGNLPYGQVFLATRPGILQTPGQPVEWRLGAADFISSTDAMLVFQFDDPSCLRILNPVYDVDLPLAPLSERTSNSLAEMGYPVLRQGSLEMLPLSKMDQVISNPEKAARPPEIIFGGEPPHRWCYYFEKADLARAENDWAEVARWGDEAFKLSMYPYNLSENLPFIEAYARLGRIKDAKKMTMDTAQQMPVLRPALCALWQRVASSGVLSESDQITAGDIQTSLQYCPVENEDE